LKHLAAACAIVALWTGGSPARANDTTEPNKDPGGRMASLAREYRELRLKRRHLPPGARLKELDDSGGRLNRILSDLGVELGRPPHTQRTVTGWLGQPDAILGKREMKKYLGVYYRGRESVSTAELRRDRKYLIYFWRGWHDFLFFITEKGVIVDHGWWFAYE
jgi:uncharacterized protein YjiS (DUF1127 family)